LATQASSEAPNAAEARPARRGRAGMVLGWLAMAVVLAVVCALLCRPGWPLYGYELKTLDSRFHYRAETLTPERVAIIAIDDRSINDTRLGRWPWDRHWHGELLKRLQADRPRAVFFDVIFADASKNPADDAALASAFKAAGNVYLGLYPGQLRSRAAGAGNPEAFAVQPGLLVHRALLPYAGAMVAPRAVLGQVAAGGAAIVGAADEDGVVRHGLLFVQEKARAGEFLYPTLLLKLASAALNLPLENMQFDLSREAQLGPGAKVPLDSQGRLVINYIGPPGTIKAMSFVDVLDGRFSPGTFKDKVVLVGFTAEGLLDVHPTPMGPKMAGVELQAQALESLLQERTLKPTQPSDAMGLTIVAAVVAALIGLFLRPWLGLFAGALLLAAYNVMSLKVFSQSGTVWPGLAPNLAVLLTFGTIAVFRVMTEEAARKRLRDEFGRYAPPQVVAKLEVGEMKVRAAGVKRPVTALFADVRGFTAWSASADPHDVISVLNTYYESMTQLAFDVEGTVDNIVGDEIFVTFNAIQDQADHVQRSVDLAINMIAALDGLNERWLASGTLPNELRIGVGLNTGEALVGSLGSHIRTQYTVLGQSINLAARLQGYNKELGTTILCTKEVAEQVSDQIEVRSHGMHEIRGHPVPIEVFEIVGRKTGTTAGASSSVPPAAPA